MTYRDVKVQDSTLSIRLYSDELSTIKKAAKTLKISLADFVRRACMEKAGKK